MYRHNIRILSIQKEVSGVNESKQSPSLVFIPVSTPEASMPKDEHYSNVNITRSDGVRNELMELSFLVLNNYSDNDVFTYRIHSLLSLHASGGYAQMDPLHLLFSENRIHRNPVSV